MQEERTAASTVRTDTEVPDLDRYASYEDGDATVICDRENPQAWVRAAETVALDP